MALDDALGIGDDQNVDPQSVMDNLIAQRGMGLPNGATVDPQSIMNRLIRRGLAKPQQQQPQQPSTTDDPASYGRATTADDDPASYGRSPEEQKATGQQPVGAETIPGETLVQSAAAAPISAVGKGLQWLTRQPVGVNPETGEGLQNTENLPPQGEKNPIYRAGKAVRKFAEENIAPSPAQAEQHKIQATVGSAIGGVLPGLAAGMVGGPIGAVAATVGTAATLGASSAEDTYEAAKAHGADDKTALAESQLAGAVNTVLGGLPLGNVLAPIGKIIPKAVQPYVTGWAMQTLAKAAESGAVFATVGEAQEFLGQQIASLYDPKDAGYIKNFEWQRLASELMAGAVLGGAHGAFAGRPAKQEQQPQPGSLGYLGGAAQTDEFVRRTGTKVPDEYHGKGFWGEHPETGEPVWAQQTGPDEYHYAKGARDAEADAQTDEFVKATGYDVPPKYRGKGYWSTDENGTKQWNQQTGPDVFRYNNKGKPDDTPPPQPEPEPEPKPPPGGPGAGYQTRYSAMRDGDRWRVYDHWNGDWEKAGDAFQFNEAGAQAFADQLNRAGTAQPGPGGPQPGAGANTSKPGGATAGATPGQANKFDTGTTGGNTGQPSRFNAAKRARMEDRATFSAMHEAGMDPKETRIGSKATPDVRAKWEAYEAARQAKLKEVRAEIASWSDDKLTNYVNEKVGFGSKRKPEDVAGMDSEARARAAQEEAAGAQPGSPSETPEETLRRFGYEDHDISSMPADVRKRTAAQIAENYPNGPPPPVDLRSSDDLRRAERSTVDGVPARATWNGMPLIIEVPQGGTRQGYTAKGQPFQSVHPHAYGRFEGLPNAKDGMAPDVIIGDHPNAPTVYVIDEFGRDGKYRQAKAFIGFQTPAEVFQSYTGITGKRPEQFGGMRAISRAEFPAWAKAGHLSEPASDAGAARAGGETYNNVSGEAAKKPPETGPKAAPGPEPTRAHRQAIIDALRATGTDPRGIRPAIIQRAAEIHEHEGFSPEDSFQLAKVRTEVEDGLLTPEKVKELYGEKIASLLGAVGAPERGPHAAAHGAGTGGKAATSETERVRGGKAHGAEGGKQAEGAGPVESAGIAGTEAAGATGEAANAGHPASRPAADHNAPGGIRPAPANERVRGEPGTTAVGQTAETAAAAVIPESEATLKAQQQQLISGPRVAQMFPKGTAELPLPKGMKRIETPSGDVFHYNPDKISPDTILKASASGNENRILGLGPLNKAEALKRIAAGEKATVVTERTPEGVEVRAAVGTEKTAAAQMAAMERGKTPGNTLQIESPKETAQGRAEAPKPAPKASTAPLIGDPVESMPEHTVTASNGMKVRVVPVVVEAKDLITSFDPGYDESLQPRDRDRAASEAQFREIIRDFDPERFGYSAEADRGAPIVLADKKVLSGNQRTRVILEIFKSHPEKAALYRTWLKSQGVDADKYEAPELARQLRSDLSQKELQEFALAANDKATLEMSAPERALNDARRITPEMLDLLRDGDLGNLENRKFVRAFIGSLPESARGNLLDRSGGLSAEGLARARGAILAKAYGDADILSRIIESTDDDVKSVSNGLIQAAPLWAKLKADIEAGSVPEEMDLTPKLLEAVKRTADIRAKGTSLEEYLAQYDAFDVSDETNHIIRSFYDPKTKRAVSGQRIAEFLRFYANQANKVSTQAGLGLGLPEVKPNEILRTAAEKAKLREAPAAAAKGGTGASAKAERPIERGPATGTGGGKSAAKRFKSRYGSSKFSESDERISDLFASEPGAEGKPQLVIPGTERISSGELAQRRANQPLRPRVAQAEPGGLFGREQAKQTDLEKAIERTQRWRVAARGQERFGSEAYRVAEKIQAGQGLDQQEERIARHVLGKWLTRKAAEYHKPEAWERRMLSSMPPRWGSKARFEDGKLANVDEMRQAYADMLQYRLNQPDVPDGLRRDAERELARLAKLGVEPRVTFAENPPRSGQMDLFGNPLSQAETPKTRVVSEKAAETDEDREIAQWWDKELTRAGRRELIAKAGLKLPDRVLWQHLSDENRTKIADAMPEEGEEEKVSEAAPSTAPHEAFPEQVAKPAPPRQIKEKPKAAAKQVSLFDWETPNERPGTKGTRPQALGGISAPEGGGPEGGGQTQRGPSGGGKSGAGRNRAPDEQAPLLGAGGQGGGTAEVHPPKAGGTGRAGRAGRGTGGNGSRVSAKPAPGISDVKPEQAPSVPAFNYRITDQRTREKEGKAEKPVDESTIVNPIDPNASNEEKLRQLHALTEENRPIVAAFMTGIDNAFGTESKSNEKDPDKIVEKGSRPEVLARKPWHRIEHVRDTFRFKTILQDYDELPAIIEKVKQAGFQIIKADVAKVLNPGDWGWRIASFDLRMPNGQLVEYYLPIRELSDKNKEVCHPLFEKWRNRKQSELTPAEVAERAADIAKSNEIYEGAWRAFLDRSGASESAISASLNKAVDSAGSLIATKSSANPPSVSGTSFQEPLTRIAENPAAATATVEGLSLSRQARFIGGVPSSDIGPGGPQNNRYAENLGEFLPQRGVPLGHQAQRYVLERGRATGREHLVAINKDGSIVAHAMGTAKQVVLPPSYTATATDPNNAIIVHHNHPSSGTLSTPDLAQLGMKGTQAIWAHGHDGTVSRAELTPFGRSLMSDNPRVNVTAIGNILNAIDKPYFDRLYILAKAGAIPPQRADKLNGYMKAETLRRAGIIHYDTNDLFEKELSEFNLNPEIDQHAALILRSLPNGFQRNPAPGRGRQELLSERSSWPDFRHPGDVGTLFAGTAPTAGPLLEQTGLNRARRALNRLKEAIPQLDLFRPDKIVGFSEPDRGGPPAGFAEDSDLFRRAHPMQKRAIYGLPLTPHHLLEQLKGASFNVSYGTRKDLGKQLGDAIRLVGKDGVLLVDNGAFSLHQQGKSTLDPRYIEDFEKWAKSILDRSPQAVAVIPDVIGGTEEQNAGLVRDWVSSGAVPMERSMPIWHLGESFDYLRHLLESGFNHLGFGSSGAYFKVGTPDWHRRIDQAFALVKDLEDQGLIVRPRIHMMRAQSQHRLYPFDSSDATTLAQNHPRYRDEGAGHVARYAGRIASKIEASATGEPAPHQLMRPHPPEDLGSDADLYALADWFNSNYEIQPREPSMFAEDAARYTGPKPGAGAKTAAGGAGGKKPPPGGTKTAAGTPPPSPRGPAQRLGQSIARVLGSDASTTAKEGLSDYNERVRQLQNETEALYHEWIDKNGKLPDTRQFYILKRLFPGKVGSKIGDFNREHFDQLQKHLRDNGITLDKAGQYVYALHAPERNRVVGNMWQQNAAFGKGGEDFVKALRDPNVVGASGMSNAEAKRIVDEAHKGPKAAAYRELARRYNDMNKFIQTELVNSGLESADTVSEWNRTYSHYANLSGFDDPGAREEAAERGTGRGDIRGPEYKTAFGRRSKAENPIVNTIERAYRTINRGERNRVFDAMGIAFSKLAEAGAPIGKALGIRLMKGRPKKVYDENTGLVRTVDQVMDRFGNNAVNFKRKGAPLYFVFDDPRLAEAARRWTAQQLRGPFQAALWLQNKMKSLWTHYSPDFLVRHNARYYVESVENAMELKETGPHSAVTHAKQAFPLIGKATKAIFAVERGEKPEDHEKTDPELADLMRSYGLMKKHGGAMALRTMRDIDQIKEDLRFKLNQMGRAKANPIRSYFDAIETMNKISSAWDNAQRLATMHSALKQGMSPQEAAIRARDATIDYQLRGLWSNTMGLWEPFFNTALRTGFRLGGALARSKIMRRVALATLAMGLMASVWNYFMGGKDTDGIPFFDKIPPWEKSKAMVLLVPWIHDAKGRPSALKFPFPYNWGGLLATGYGIGNLLFGSASVEETIREMFIKPWVSMFSQVGEEGLGVRSIVPELLRPEYDIATNTDWTGRPIHRDERGQNRPKSWSGKGDYGGRPGTGEAWKFAAETLNAFTGGNRTHAGWLDLYPEDLRELFSQFIGTQVGLAHKTWTAGSKLVHGELPAPAEVPILHIFAGQDYDAANKHLQYLRQQKANAPWKRIDLPRKPLVDLF
jgi:hypothetical protein